MGRLEGKVAVVTGAGSGIGRAVAELFAREGAAVVGVGRRREPLEEMMAAVEHAGGRAVLVTADVSRPEAGEHVVGAAVERFGGLDILVNNASVGWSYETQKPGSMAPLADTPPEMWREVMAINLDSVFHMTHRAIPELRRRGGGAIVNVASLGGIRGFTDAHTYTAAKGAVVNLTRSLALTYGRENIRTNCVAPGVTETEMVEGKMNDIGRPFDHEATRYVLSPLGRPAQPVEVAYPCLFLASDEASYVNGVILLVDGGVHCGFGV